MAVSIRLRMALGVTALVGAVLVLGSVVTHQLLRSTLLAGIERDVAQRAAALSASPPSDLDVFAAPDVFLQAVDPAGRPVRSSGNLGARKLPVPPEAREGMVVEVRVEGRPLFLTAAPLADGGHMVVARSPVTVYGGLRQLRRLLTIVDLVGLVLTGTLGWLFAALTLRPVSRVTGAAERVRTSRDLTQRVVHRGPADEIGRLAETFNAMLAELDAAYESLGRSNERLRQFLADCAHELRSPLTLLLSNVDLAAKLGDADPQFRTQALADIQAAAERMARMITQLLILARADSGIAMQQQPVRLRDVVEAACRDEERMVEDVQFDPGSHDQLDAVVVRGSSDHLRQVLLILLDNAVKYTPTGGQVRVRSGIDDGWARVSVIDTGVGIDPQDLPYVFDRFYRGSRTKGATGTGLGLAIAQWVAAQHGGRIEVESTPAKGSRFTLLLPVRHPTA